MEVSLMITIGLVALIVLGLPMWAYSKRWGGGYTPSIFGCFMLAAHFYTMLSKP